MAFKFTENLYDYDVFPLVFKDGQETEINIRRLGREPQFEPDTEYDVVFCAMEMGDPRDFPATADFQYEKVKSDSEGNFTFKHTFNGEQEYLIRFLDSEGKRINQFPVYCVAEDLAGRYPFIGDLHMHTNNSDGKQDPEVVCANYRRHGYDFMVVSDHRRYYPSLNAIKAYKDVPIELNIVQGEEVHMPPVHGKTNDVHIVNFGGEYSINSLVESVAVEEVGKDISVRATRTENVPDVMTMEEYENKMQALADEIKVPENVDAVPAAVCKWIFDNIRNANGLGIFAHPTWRKNVYHIPEAFTDYLMATKPFDAFEVLGGENYFEHNGFQTVRYYEEKAKGNRFPIVGSTDSHSSYPLNRNAYICSTIVFSAENERTALIKAIKDYYSVAVDTISEEFRLVGDNRLVRYGCFLIKNYFPRHDELCYEEGRLMKQYVTGTASEREEAAEILKAINGRMKRFNKKYFAF